MSYLFSYAIFKAPTIINVKIKIGRIRLSFLLLKYNLEFNSAIISKYKGYAINEKNIKYAKAKLCGLSKIKIEIYNTNGQSSIGNSIIEFRTLNQLGSSLEYIFNLFNIFIVFFE